MGPRPRLNVEVRQPFSCYMKKGLETVTTSGGAFGCVCKCALICSSIYKCSRIGSVRRERELKSVPALLRRRQTIGPCDISQGSMSETSLGQH